MFSLTAPHWRSELAEGALTLHCITLRFRRKTQVLRRCLNITHAYSLTAPPYNSGLVIRRSAFETRIHHPESGELLIPRVLLAGCFDGQPLTEGGVLEALVIVDTPPSAAQHEQAKVQPEGRRQEVKNVL